MILTEQELKKLDKDIDSGIRQFPLLSHTRNIAVYTVLMIYEWVNFQQFEDSISGKVSREESFTKACELLDVFDHAMKWSIKFCDVELPKRHKLDTEETFELGIQMLSQAYKYEPVVEDMSSMFRGWAEGERASDNTINVNFDQSSEHLEFELADVFLRDINNPFINTGDENIDYDVARIPLRFGAKLNADDTVSYRKDKSVLEPLLKAHEVLYRKNWDLDDGIDFGGYKSEELLRFWSTLASLCLVRLRCYYAFMMAGHTNKLGIHLIENRPINSWVDEVSYLADLPRNTVKRIIRHFTMSVENYGKSDPLPEFVYLPFFHCFASKISLSGSLLLKSNLNRSVANVLSLSKPKLYSGIQNRRSSKLIEMLTPFFDREGIMNTKEPIKYPGGDIDLVAVDEIDKCILCFEVKAFRTVHSDNERKVVIKELKKAISQAKRSVNWVMENQQQFITKLNYSLKELSLTDLKDYDIYPLVVTPGHMFIAYVWDEEAPTVNAMLVDHVLRKAEGRKLRHLYRVAREKAFLPREGTHFKMVTGTRQHTFGGITLKSNKPGYEILRKWDPEVDISIGQLTSRSTI